MSAAWLNREIAEMTENTEAIIRNLCILADGCRKHPAYRAKHRATGNCEPCVRMYDARLQLNELKGEPDKS
jgi:hypothetical protein